ncbi:alpha/beta hydrolase [Catenulispora pinisilvae]|uniref:alpha/beta hydrolase n=1 Tax=Catenulispora pinisilvae TaxID=2705253 RepID=UPI001890FABD|nr:alpha/beta hydrolase [Catenulispora pinisilvae]
MTLDPSARAIVDVLTAVFPDLGETVTDAVQAREILAHAPELPILVELPSVVDRTVPGPEGAPEVPVRIYRPVADQDADPDAVTPVVVFFHGGGFSICNIAVYDNFCRDLAHSTGATVVSVEYRLAPETPYPGGLNDAYAVTSWVSSHAAELRVDPARLAVAGDSSGGNFAAVVSLMARDRAAQGSPSPAIALQLLIYPSVDIGENGYPSREENATGFFLTAKHMAWFHEQYVQGADVADPYMSPINAPDLSGLPRACIVTAEHDPLRDEGDAYAARLAAAGVAVEHLPVEGMFHGFLNMPHPTAAKTRAAVFAAVRAGLAVGR